MRIDLALLFAALLLLAVPDARAAATPIKVRVVVVANFEDGADTGDAPGEFQDWVEREHLDETVPVRGAPDVVRRNRQGLYGMVCSATIRTTSSATISATSTGGTLLGWVAACQARSRRRRWPERPGFTGGYPAQTMGERCYLR